jgi:cytochrome c biogenesis protein CcmG/thiol:disulfide interchange protein DsbE
VSVRRLAWLLGAAVVVGLIVFEVATAGNGGDVGRPAPALPRKVLQGPAISLADLRGRPALIDFFASWCEPCREEAGELAQLGHSVGSAARIVAVDYTDREASGRAFVARYGWTFPVLSDPDGVYGARYGFSGLPTAVVLDSRGRIAATLRGPQTLTGFRRALEQAGGERG